MTRKSYARLAFAVAMATSFTVPASAAQQEDAATVTAQAAQPAGAQAKQAVSAADEAEASRAVVAAAAADAEKATQEIRKEEQKTSWAKNRPSEEEIMAYKTKYNGETIVDIVIDGASDATKETAKAALSEHAGDKYDADKMEKDRLAISKTGFFYDIYPSFEKVPEGIVLTYHVLENPVLKSVRIEGNKVEKTEDLTPLVTVKPGVILNSSELHKNVQQIQEKYRGDGYILAKITDLNIDKDGNLLININEGVIENFLVKGNKKTKNYVILREMRQKKGEPFNAKLARRSLQRVFNLGFFEDVNMKLNPGVNPNAIIMEIDVKEKRTGQFGIGAGYSTQDGVVGSISIGDTNFRGMGDAINLMYEVGGGSTDSHGYTFSYRRPWLDQKETVGTLRIYNRTYEYDEYNDDGDYMESYMRKYSGGEITVGRPISEYSTNYLTLRNRKDEYLNHTGGSRNNEDNTQWKKDNFGTTRSIVLEHVTDSRDNVYYPTMGGRIALTGEVSGFGGDFHFQKVDISDQRYFKAGKNQVWATRMQYGWSRGHLSWFNQYKLGGQDTLRGYRDDQFRGNHMALFTLEYRFPIMSKVQGALFTDWGSAWDSGLWPDGLNGSIGIGVFITTPLGPLRLDYGHGKNGNRLHFNVGSSF